ncbi:MAG: potassium transporter TrkA [Hyphomicrobiaceae bacterium]|nr:MAG: potassium transporter TrkA [Hyphomicrobiaceae bacterium]
MGATLNIAAYKDALIVLGTAGVVVPVVHRLKVSPILGFLFAGAVLGPYGLGALADRFPPLGYVTISRHEENLSSIAEFGVVFLLFLIGLELSLPRLKTMRRLVFGLGALQVALSTAVIGAFLSWQGLKGDAALVLAAALALSSTAIVVEILSRQHRLSTASGRTTFSVLLFQDLAVVPVIFLVPILGSPGDQSILLSLAKALVQGAVAIGAIVIVGRLLLRPLFKQVAATHSPELFMAACLFVAVGTSLLSAAAGLSMAIGAFVAGLLLAETEYRRAIEGTIEPFKGLLLGVFFFAVGMSLDLSALLANPFALMIAAIGLIAVKAAIVMLLARSFQVGWPAATETGFLLGPGGEFAFVIIALAASYDMLTDSARVFALTVVSLSMAAIPACSWAARHLANRIEQNRVPDPALLEKPPQDHKRRAIIVGYGRVGQMVATMLDKHAIAYLASERDPVLVGKWRRAGKPIYFGDARHENYLRSFGIDEASAIIITIHTQSEIDEIVRAVRQLRPNLPIISRARDAAHARHLYDLGVDDAVPETIEASLQLAEAALVSLGEPMGRVIAAVHEERDLVRRDLQGAAAKAGKTPIVRKKATEVAGQAKS